MPGHYDPNAAPGPAVPSVANALAVRCFIHELVSILM